MRMDATAPRTGSLTQTRITATASQTQVVGHVCQEPMTQHGKATFAEVSHQHQPARTVLLRSKEPALLTKSVQKRGNASKTAQPAQAHLLTVDGSKSAVHANQHRQPVLQAVKHVKERAQYTPLEQSHLHEPALVQTRMEAQSGVLGKHKVVASKTRQLAYLLQSQKLKPVHHTSVESKHLPVKAHALTRMEAQYGARGQ